LLRSAAGTMKLMNCRRCDDIVKAVLKARSCECGSSECRELEDGQIQVAGAARVIAIQWCEYDAATPDDAPYHWEILSEPHPDIVRH
jgi:hypothetical protein